MLYAMMRRLPLLSLLLLLCTAGNSYADDYTGAKVNVIEKTTVTSSGEPIQYLQTERPEVTALIVEIPPGGETGWHLHPVPVYAYVLSGSLVVEMDGGRRHDYKAGDAIIESLNRPHNGKNVGQIPVKLIVFYTGEEGKPITVRAKRENN